MKTFKVRYSNYWDTNHIRIEVYIKAKNANQAGQAIANQIAHHTSIGTAVTIHTVREVLS